MTLEELVNELRRLKRESAYDPEVAHAKADEALLDYIDSVEVDQAFSEVRKWYA